METFSNIASSVVWVNANVFWLHSVFFFNGTLFNRMSECKLEETPCKWLPPLPPNPKERIPESISEKGIMISKVAQSPSEIRGLESLSFAPC